MDIKCNTHPKSLAAYMCEECGFLCEEHKAGEIAKGHVLLSITKAFTDLYNSIFNKKKNDMLTLSMAMIKEQINRYLNNQMVSTKKMDKQTLNTIIDDNKQRRFGIHPNIVSGHILSSIAKLEDEIKHTSSVSVIDNLILLLNNAKERILNEKDAIKKAQARVFEYYQKYAKSEITGYILHRK